MKKRVKKGSEKKVVRNLVICGVLVFVFIILMWGLFYISDKLVEEYYKEKFELRGELRSITPAGSSDYCSDDDGGVDYSINGACRDNAGTYLDVCIGDDLREYYCSNRACTSSLHACNNSCDDGRCFFTSINRLPDFSAVCGRVEFDKNTNHTMNIVDCFSDADGDNLTFSYTAMNMANISISRSGDNLILAPQIDFIGNGSFSIYANDSKNITQGNVDVVVKEPSTDDNGGDDNGGYDNYFGSGCISVSISITCGSWVCGTKKDNCNKSVTCGNCTAGKICSNGVCIIPAPKITSSSPPGVEVNITTDGSLMFSVNVDSYDSIEWYVDGVLMKSGVTSYTVSGLSVGNHEIKVVIKKGEQVTTKTWSLAVYEEKESPKRGIWLYFIIIFIILGALILVTILLLIRNVLGKGKNIIGIKAINQPKLPQKKVSKAIKTKLPQKKVSKAIKTK